jgi:hypothetical protein
MRIKKIIKQRNSEDHISAIIKNLVTCLNIDVSFSAIDQAVQNHPLFPEIEDLNDILNEWGIKTNTIKTTMNELSGMVFPILAQMGMYNYYYVLVLKIDKQSVTYIHTEKGLVIENIYIFEQNWNGSIEIIETNPNSGEEDYKQSFKDEMNKYHKKKYLQALCLLIIVLIIFLGTQFNNSSLKWMPFLVLETIGAYFSIVVLLANYKESKLFNSFLFLGNRTLDRLNFKNYEIDHKILGKFYSKEIIAFYFWGGLFYLFLGIICNQLNSFLFLLSILNILFIPIVIYNLFKFNKVKSHILYPIINIILLCEFPFIISNIFNPFSSNYNFWITFFLALIIPSTVWLLIKPKLVEVNELALQVQDLKNFRHPSIRGQLFDSSPLININRSKYEIYCGDANANMQITIFISPIDLRSGYLFLFLREMVNEYMNVKLITKFIISNNYFSNFVTRQILSYFTINSPEDTSSLIESWYLDNTKDIISFKNKYKIQGINQDTVDQMMDELEKVSQKVNDEISPIVLINNRKVPHYFEVEDIKYIIKNDPLRIQPFAKTEKDKFWKDRRPF